MEVRLGPFLFPAITRFIMSLLVALGMGFLDVGVVQTDPAERLHMLMSVPAETQARQHQLGDEEHRQAMPQEPQPNRLTPYVRCSFHARRI